MKETEEIGLLLLPFMEQFARVVALIWLRNMDQLLLDL